MAKKTRKKSTSSEAPKRPRKSRSLTSSRGRKTASDASSEAPKRPRKSRKTASAASSEAPKKARKKTAQKARKKDEKTVYQKKIEQARRVGKTRDNAIARKTKYCSSVKKLDHEIKELQAIEHSSIEKKIAAKKLALKPSGVKGERNVVNPKSGSIVITGTNPELQEWFASRYPGFNASIEAAVARKRSRTAGLLEGASRAVATATCARLKRRNLAAEIKRRRAGR